MYKLCIKLLTYAETMYDNKCTRVCARVCSLNIRVCQEISTTVVVYAVLKFGKCHEYDCNG
jgi:hypothetical protein